MNVVKLVNLPILNLYCEVSVNNFITYYGNETIQHESIIAFTTLLSEKIQSLTYSQKKEMWQFLAHEKYTLTQEIEAKLLDHAVGYACDLLQKYEVEEETNELIDPYASLLCLSLLSDHNLLDTDHWQQDPTGYIGDDQEYLLYCLTALEWVHGKTCPSYVSREHKEAIVTLTIYFEISSEHDQGFLFTGKVTTFEDLEIGSYFSFRDLTKNVFKKCSISSYEDLWGYEYKSVASNRVLKLKATDA